MPFAYRYAFPVMWFSWVVYWWVASRDVKSTIQRESLPSRLSASSLFFPCFSTPGKECGFPCSPSAFCR